MPTLPSKITVSGAGTVIYNGDYSLISDSYYTKGGAIIGSGPGIALVGATAMYSDLDYATGATGGSEDYDLVDNAFPVTSAWQVVNGAQNAPTVTVWADTVAPAFASASINSAGTTLTINWTEADSAPVLQASGKGATQGITLACESGDVSVSAVSTTGTATTATLSRTVTQGEALLLSIAAGAFTDSAAAHNATAAISDQPIGNGSDQTLSTASTHKLVFSTGSLVANWVDGDGDAQTATFAILQDISLDITFNRAYLYDAAQNSIFPVDHADSMGHAQLKASNATISADTLQRLVAASLSGMLGEGTVTATLPKQVALPSFQAIFTGQGTDGKGVVATFENAKAKGRNIALKLSDFAMQDFTLDCYPDFDGVIGTIAFTN